MGHRSGALAIVTLGLLLAGAAPLVAQRKSSSPNDIQLADLRAMKDKFVGLAGAFPADKYDWRPMEGVRSVKDVLVLLTNEGNLFPTQWGAPAALGVLSDRKAEEARLQALDKAALTAELGRAFDNMIGFVAGMDEAKHATEIRFFGQTVQVGAAVMMASGDMHEHLGQLIAYARSNRIVPPWSRPPA
ncbi:MAG: hypothetical protein EXR95_06940 [Gemmatimonadetes bacterium]|nr:hypothetical protein [Gemmatimonadota bacterium]